MTDIFITVPDLGERDFTSVSDRLMVIKILDFTCKLVPSVFIHLNYTKNHYSGTSKQPSIYYKPTGIRSLSPLSRKSKFMIHKPSIRFVLHSLNRVKQCPSILA